MIARPYLKAIPSPQWCHLRQNVHVIAESSGHFVKLGNYTSWAVIKKCPPLAGVARREPVNITSVANECSLCEPRDGGGPHHGLRTRAIINPAARSTSVTARPPKSDRRATSASGGHTRIFDPQKHKHFTCQYVKD